VSYRRYKSTALAQPTAPGVLGPWPRAALGPRRAAAPQVLRREKVQRWQG